MTDLSGKIAADFGRKLARQMQEHLQREVALIQPLVNPPDLMMMLTKLAAGLSNAVILVGLQTRNDNADAGSLYDLLKVAIERMTDVGKPEILEILAAIEARGARTPAQTEMLVKRGAL